MYVIEPKRGNDHKMLGLTSLLISIYSKTISVEYILQGKLRVCSVMCKRRERQTKRGLVCKRSEKPLTRMDAQT